MWRCWARVSSVSAPRSRCRRGAARSPSWIGSAEVASETSFGNTGIVQSEAAYPYTFPRDPSRSSTPRSTAIRAPNKVRGAAFDGAGDLALFLASAPAGERSGKGLRALVAGAVAEHRALAAAAGAEACCARAAGSRRFAPRAGGSAALTEAEETRALGVS